MQVRGRQITNVFVRVTSGSTHMLEGRLGAIISNKLNMMKFYPEVFLEIIRANGYIGPVFHRPSPEVTSTTGGEPIKYLALIVFGQ